MIEGTDYISKNTDDFFEIASKIFLQITENGIAEFNSSDFLFQFESVQRYFVAGIDELKNGLLPDVLEIILEWKEKSIIASKKLSDQEILELTLLKNVFRYYYAGDIELFLDICNQMCSNNCYNQCELILRNQV